MKHVGGLSAVHIVCILRWIIVIVAVIVGEIANFAAYAFAPAILVTPLGALSIIIRQGNIHFAVLAHVMLQEKLHIFGILGCVLCVVGSITIVLHAPQEREIESVKEVWDLATEPAVIVIIIRVIPYYGQTHVMVYISVCSLMGSLSVCVVVSPIYYVMFTTLTILASVIMFKDWDGQNATQIVTEVCGFVTILSGTFLLHKTKDMIEGSSQSLSSRLPKHDEEDGVLDHEGVPLRRLDSLRPK
ncbi:hypothetical protein OIU74_027091 [Salix koriyanagi]|uniref:Probable magnesium transporter n=1 Tax=Salix koriyanagi TaxID=2511006 RepID=A0A9Q0VZR7_9ROSI|nr:hypothetical protein OIU74_027091 [Salix koriyanagi]